MVGITLLLTGVLVSGILLHKANQNTAYVSTPSERPNFIIILADDIGWGDLGANQPGQRANNTPNIDLLALQGLRYGMVHFPHSALTFEYPSWNSVQFISHLHVIVEWALFHLKPLSKWPQTDSCNRYCNTAQKLWHKVP